MSQILLVEPDRVLGNIYSKALAKAGHTVVMCAGAQSAITAADDTTPDLVILELQLIEHSGIEFLYEFRSYPEWRDIPVIVFSSVPPAEFTSSRSLLVNELGVRAYFYKSSTSLRSLLASVNGYSSLPA
jgi:DNA-binding response OmpR family regulator